METMNVRDVLMTKREREWIEKLRKLTPGFAERARHYDLSGEFPEQNLQELAEAGFLNLVVPAEYGGEAGEALFCEWLPTLVIYEIAKVDAGTAWCLFSHYHACGQMAGLENEQLKRRIFTDVVENRARIATIQSEVKTTELKTDETQVPRGKVIFGSDDRIDEDGFYINGFKGFTSTAAYSDYIIYWHMAPGTGETGEGILLSIVPRDRAGIEFLPGWENAIGIRSSASGPARFTEMHISWDEVLGEPGDWVQRHPFTHEILYAALLIGCAEAAYEFALDTVRGREYLQREGTVMSALGGMSSDIQASWESCRFAAKLWSLGLHGEAAHATLRALHQAKRSALAIATECFDIVGTRSLLRTNPLERIWRDVRVATLHTREAWHMEMVARGDISGHRFPKEKYGAELTERRTLHELTEGLAPVDRGKL